MRKFNQNLKSNNKGITLIALVITIVVMLILAAITVNLVLGENGIIKRAKEAIFLHKKAEYFQKIDLEISLEQIERASEAKNESFIESLENKFKALSWVKSTIICDEFFNRNEDIYKNNVLIIITKDKYEIYIDVDNIKLLATIRNESFSKETKPCTIKYDSNGGQGTMDEQNIKKDFYVLLSENIFEKEYYKFVGWSEDKEGNETRYSEKSKMKVEKDITLYAIWSKNVAEIHYLANDGTDNSNIEEIEKGKETQLKANEFTREGYEFIGWNTSADGSGTSYEDNDMITTNENVNLYAQWIETYTINYISNGGNGTMAEQKVRKGTQVTILENQFTNNGYVFIKWNTKSDGSGTSYNSEDIIVLNDNLELYAIWQSEKVTVSFDSNKGKGTIESIQIEKGNELNLPANTFTRSGYCFLNWNTKADGTGTTYTNKITTDKDVTLYAIWENQMTQFRYIKIELTKCRDIPNAGIVQIADWYFFDNNNTKFSYPSSTTITSSLGQTSSGERIANILDGDSSTKWCGNRNWGNSQTGLCTIVIDLGVNNYIDFTIYNKYAYCTANDMTNRDPISWIISGSKDGTNYLAVSLVDDENITTSRKTLSNLQTIHTGETEGDYKVEYDANGGTGAPSTESSPNSNIFTIPNTKPTRTGYIFESWNTKSDGTGLNYYAGDRIISYNTKLYAKWRDERYLYRYIKIEITKLKGVPNAGIVQIADWYFFNNNNTKFSYPSSTTITSSLGQTSSGEKIANILDGNSSTKWCGNKNWGSSQTGSCTIVIDLGADQYIDISEYTKYSYCTANDMTNRDPISWTISVSKNGTTYTQICQKNDANVTNNRNTLCEYWSLQ